MKYLNRYNIPSPKRWATLGATLLLSLQLNAAAISLDDARNVAMNWMAEKTGKTYYINTQKYTSNVVKKSGIFNSTAYRIIKLEPKGWVIVSSDDIAKPIIGYGLSDMNTGSIPIAFENWMHGVERSILCSIHDSVRMQSSNKKYVILQSNIQKEWQRLKSNSADSKRNTAAPTDAGDNTYVVNPLLWQGGNSENSGIVWDQGEYYNQQCPFDSNGPGDHVWTGCVATAVGQIMRYHGAPATGTGAHSYECNTNTGCEKDYGTLSADFSATAYDWPNMPNKLDSNSNSTEINAVSTLLYHIGIGVEMAYDTSGSGAYSTMARDALNNYFGYSSVYRTRSGYTDSDWHALIQGELSNNRPLYYDGGDSSGGHAFVLDGYDADGYYHFNWGWSGAYNGKYAIDDLTPGGSDFSANQGMMTIAPAAGGLVANAGANKVVTEGTSVTLDASGSTGSINSYEWRESGTVLSTAVSFTKSDFSVGTHTLVLTVGDNNGATDTDTVIVTIQSSGGGGGGCTYDPSSTGFDLMILLMLLASISYPLRRKFLR